MRPNLNTFKIFKVYVNDEYKRVALIDEVRSEVILISEIGAEKTKKFFEDYYNFMKKNSSDSLLQTVILKDNSHPYYKQILEFPLDDFDE
jgi:hypothetical protein